MENCSICLEPLEDNVVELEECRHKFHSTCIVKWFRSQNASCPQCRGLPNLNLTHQDAMARYKVLIQHAKRKNAPLTLKRAIAKVKQMEDAMKKRKRKRREISKEVRELKKDPKIKEFLQKIQKISQVHQFNDNEKLRLAKYVVGATDFGTNLLAITSVPNVPRENVPEDEIRYTLA